jgi:type II secretory pathway component GspD/PulD (secretin)
MGSRAVRPFAFALALLVLGTAPAGVRADEPSTPKPPGPVSADAENATITIGDEGVDIATLLRNLNVVMRTPIVWQDRDKSIEGRKIIGPRTIKAPPGKILDSVRALLTFYDLVMVPLGPKGYETYVVLDARQTMSVLRLKCQYVDVSDSNVDELASQDGLYVSANIRVQNMENLRDARNALSRMVTQQNIGSVTEVPDARAFLVTDFAPNVAAIYRAVRAMDVVPTGAKTETGFFELRHAHAVNVARILQELFGEKKAATPVPPNPQMQFGEARTPEMRFAADPESNQVVVIAPAIRIAEMRVVVEKLDRPPAGEPSGPK